MHALRTLPLALPLFLPLQACTPSSAAAPAEEPERSTTSITLFGERVLLFMEHPYLVRGEPARFLAHFSVLASGEPVRSGRVELAIGPTRLAVTAPKRDGLFIPEGAPLEAGRFEARITVASAEVEETLALGSLVVHASAAEAEQAAAAETGAGPTDAIPFLMESQWKARLLLAEAGGREVSERLALPARVLAPEGRAAVVSASVGGRLLAPPTGALPTTGARVEAGALLGYIEPPLTGPELLELGLRELELESRALEILRAQSEARARLAGSQRERERIGRLRAEGLGTQRELEQAERELALAQAELTAAEGSSEALARWRSERAASGALLTEGMLRLPLLAPLAGEVVEAPVPVGVAVAAGETLFRILDGSRLWIEGSLSELDLAALERITGAWARFPALPGVELALSGPRDGRPYLGPEVDPSSHTLRLRYELENAQARLRPGMTAELALAIGTHRATVAIPEEAVVKDQGLPCAYVMLEGELFQKRELELGARDGGWVEVLRGLETGERVATRGANLVRLAALSPASFGHGHSH